MLTFSGRAAAQSQNEVTLVSNAELLTRYSVTNFNRVGAVGDETRTLAQEFTTGANSQNYEITKISLRIRELGNGDTARVSIYSNTSPRVPGTLLHTLRTRSNTPDGWVDFTPSGSLTLRKDTTYHVVVDAPRGDYILLDIDTRGEDASSQSDWDIGRLAARFDTGRQWLTASNNAISMTVTGKVVQNPECIGGGSSDAEIKKCLRYNLYENNSIGVNVTEPTGSNSRLTIRLTHRFREDRPLYTGADLVFVGIRYYVYGYEAVGGALPSRDCIGTCTVVYDDVRGDGNFNVGAFLKVREPGEGPTKEFHLNWRTETANRFGQILFESNFLGDCKRGRDSSGRYWKFSYLNDERSRTVNRVEVQDDGLVDCMGIDGLLPDRLEEPNRIWQVQICQGNKCVHPLGYSIQQHSTPPINSPPVSNLGGRSRWLCLDSAGEPKKQCTFGEVAATVAATAADLDQPNVTLILRNKTYAGNPRDFHRTIAPQFEDDEAGAYALLTRCDGIVCRNAQAVERRDMKKAVPDPAPGPPRSSRARVSEEAVLRVTWSAPSASGSEPIIRYQVFFKCSEESAWRLAGPVGPNDRSYQGSIRDYLTSSNCETSSNLDVRIRAESQGGNNGPWVIVQATIPDEAKEAKEEDTPADEANGGSDSNSAPEGTPPSDGKPVTATVNSANTRITVMFQDPNNDRCSNYYIEAWGSVGHLHRVTHSDGAGSLTLPYSKNDSASKNDKTRIDVLCGTFTGDDGRRWKHDVITKENPGNNSGQRWLGSQSWFYD